MQIACFNFFLIFSFSSLQVRHVLIFDFNFNLRRGIAKQRITTITTLQSTVSQPFNTFGEFGRVARAVKDSNSSRLYCRLDPGSNLGSGDSLYGEIYMVKNAPSINVK